MVFCGVVCRYTEGNSCDQQGYPTDLPCQVKHMACNVWVCLKWSIDKSNGVSSRPHKIAIWRFPNGWRYHPWSSILYVYIYIDRYIYIYIIRFSMIIPPAIRDPPFMDTQHFVFTGSVQFRKLLEKLMGCQQELRFIICPNSVGWTTKYGCNHGNSHHNIITSDTTPHNSGCTWPYIHF